MCGIIGYAGPRLAAPILVDGLKRLEYRGYDSAGVAMQSGAGLEVRKLKGRVSDLTALLADEPLAGFTGIAHTRWATHGAPNTTNAHPHTDCSGDIALVHNGIIENADVLRAALQRTGHTFVSETDTETLVHLIEEAPGDTLEDRVISALSHVEGAYGLLVVSAMEPGKMVVARRGSPVLIGIGDGEHFVASDASAVFEHTRSVVYLDDGDVAVVTSGGYRILDLDANELQREVSMIDWELGAIELAGYDHFMLKEICEQPQTVHNTLRGRCLHDEGTARLGGVDLGLEEVSALRRIVILACGTSWHAALVGRYVLESLVRVPVEVEYASEYRYRRQLDVPGTLAVAISQSGETADTLEAMRAAHGVDATVLGIVNVVGSTIARESDGGMYLHAGPEIGVASTKAFTSQIVALILMALKLGRLKGFPQEKGQALVRALGQLPNLVKRTLAVEDQIKALAREFCDAQNFLYLGRGVNFPVALEGALKLKEISYIHAEGYPAAEMKHGPIALIDQNMPVVVVAPDDELYRKVLSNMQKVKARGGRVIAITSEGSPDLGALVDHQVRVPHVRPLLSPIVTVVPLQLLAYHIAVLRGCDVDKPRNLAKSVTVE